MCIRPVVGEGVTDTIEHRRVLICETLTGSGMVACFPTRTLFSRSTQLQTHEKSPTNAQLLLLLLLLNLFSVAAANNLAYLLARDALHTLAAAARQAPRGLEHDHSTSSYAGVTGTGLQFEDPSRGVMKTAELSSEASRKVPTTPPRNYCWL